MKNGMAILWEGPEATAEGNACYSRSLRDLIARELVDINKHFSRNGLKMLDFTVMELPVAGLNKKTDC